MLYVKRAAELLNIINHIEDQSNISYAVKTIQSVVEWGLGAAATQGNNVDVNARLDGVFSFLIECEKHKNDNEFYVYIPIKYLPVEIEEGLSYWMYGDIGTWGGFNWDFTHGAENQRGVLEVYLEEKGYEVVDIKIVNHVEDDKNNQTPSFIGLRIKKL